MMSSEHSSSTERSDEDVRKILEEQAGLVPPTIIINPDAKPAETGPKNPDGSGEAAKDR